HCYLSIVPGIDISWQCPLTLHVALPIFERDDEVVERAGDLRAMDDALAERAALVRAAVLEREHGVVRGAEHRDAPRGRLYAACADRKSTRLNSSHVKISYAVFCLKKKKL